MSFSPITQKLFATLLVAGVLSLLVFMVIGVHHGDHGAGCLASSVQSADCPTNVAAAIPFHLAALKDLFATAPSTNAGMMMLLIALFALVTVFDSVVASLPHLFKRSWVVVSSTFETPSERDFTRWLARHEVSPSLTT